jgi:P-type Ca2+ transporter type 2C
MEIKYPIEFAYTFTVDEIVSAIETNVQNGITQAEADIRIKQFGANIYAAQKPKSIWLMLLLQFKSPIVYLLFKYINSSM